MESTVGLETFGIKMLARAAVQTSAIRVAAADKRPGQISVPTAENASDNTYFVAKSAHFFIIDKFSYLILF